MGGEKRTYGAKSRGDVLFFDPNDLVIVTDRSSAIFDERAELAPAETMIRNVMIHGILEPVICRRNGEQVEVVAGRQRVLAAREANKRLSAEGAQTITVPIVWRRGDDATMLGITISENEIRRDDTPLTKARKLQRLMDLGKTSKECADIFGVTTGTIGNWLALLDCADPIQKAVEKGHVPANVATILSKLPRDEQTTKLEEIVAEGPAKGLQAVRAAQKAVGKTNGLRMRSRKEMTTLLEQLDGETIDPRKILRWCMGEDTLPKRLLS